MEIPHKNAKTCAYTSKWESQRQKWLEKGSVSLDQGNELEKEQWFSGLEFKDFPEEGETKFELIRYTLKSTRRPYQRFEGYYRLEDVIDQYMYIWGGATNGSPDQALRRTTTKRKNVKYQKLPEEQPIEDQKMEFDDPLKDLTAFRKGGSQQQNQQEQGQNLRKHEVYDNTYYIPNNKIRVLEIPMSSSLTFQMLLYYHFYYDMLLVVLVFTTQIYKIWVMEVDILYILALIFTLIWFPIELARLNFGYKGNINETFPELIAFIIFTIFFIIPFSAIPFIQSFKFPHENAVYFINYIFIICELILGFVVMCRFMNTQSAAFYLRTAPIIDKNFRLKYQNMSEIKSSREIELGLRRHDRMHDTVDVFEESDKLIVSEHQINRTNMNNTIQQESFMNGVNHSPDNSMIYAGKMHQE